MVLQLWQFTAILSSALFAGAALYISLAEHPARMQCGAELAATVFVPSYQRAARMQAILAFVATLSSVACWWLLNSLLWLAGGILIFAVIPFTLIVIFPTNKQLLAPDIDRKSPSTRALLLRWGRLHVARTATSLAATVMMIGAVVFE